MGELRAHYVYVYQTTYHFNNKSSEEQTVTLEHEADTQNKFLDLIAS